MENQSSPPITNYKGVMLCNRPNENIFIPKERPFCSRVNPHEALGLLPQKDSDGSKVSQQQRQPNIVLKRHKRWLEEFKLTNQIKKQQELEQQFLEEDKFNKVREMAKKDREVTKKMKQEYRQMNELIMKEINENGSTAAKPLPLTEKNLKKLDEQPTEKPKKQKEAKQLKPKWALTQEQEEVKELEEADELLTFVQNLDYDQYVNDLEVNIMLKALKQRVNELRQDTNWRENAEKNIDQEGRSSVVNNGDQKPAEDIYDRISQNLNKNDEAKSVASEKTQNSIQKLREEKQKAKEGKQDWDKTTTAKPLAITLEDRIAKNVADEILRNYKHLGNVHSNNSIRKLLEKEAKKTLNEGTLPGPLIHTIKSIDKTKSGVDPNNLPYLHRNPAI